MINRECRGVDNTSLCILDELDSKTDVSWGEDCYSFKSAIPYICVMSMDRDYSAIVNLVIIVFTFFND